MDSQCIVRVAFRTNRRKGECVLQRKSVCPTHSEAKQYPNVGVWNRERFIAGPCKEMGGSCLKNPKLPESFQQRPFIGKVREGCD